MCDVLLRSWCQRSKERVEIERVSCHCSLFISFSLLLPPSYVPLLLVFPPYLTLVSFSFSFSSPLPQTFSLSHTSSPFYSNLSPLLHPHHLYFTYDSLYTSSVEPKIKGKSMRLCSTVPGWQGKEEISEWKMVGQSLILVIKFAIFLHEILFSFFSFTFF